MGKCGAKIRRRTCRKGTEPSATVSFFAPRTLVWNQNSCRIRLAYGHIGCRWPNTWNVTHDWNLEGGKSLKKLLKIATASLACAFLLAGCSKSSETTNNNANSEAVATTRPGPDNSEISTTTDANGVKTETRTFKNNPHISKIVVTTKNGVKTARVYSKNGEEKELSNSQSQNVLEETGNAVKKVLP